MAAPVISTIVPAVGRSLGKTFVVITGTGFNVESGGGTVNVLFGGVQSPRFGVVDATKVIAQTPGGAVGSVDVTVENIGAGGAPVEPDTVTAGFEYKRASIATPRDFSNHGCISLITRELLKEFRRTIIDNVWNDMHPEYADVASAAEENEKQSEAPHIKIVGPDVQWDRFHSINGEINEQITPAPGTFDVRSQPVTVMLQFDHIAVGRTSGEAVNIHKEIERYFNDTPFLIVPNDGVDPSLGSVSYELAPVFEERANFRSRSTRQGVYQFTGSFVVRVVDIAGDKVFEGVDVADEVEVTTEPKP